MEKQITQYELLENEYKWIFRKINNTLKVLKKENNFETFTEFSKMYKHEELLNLMFEGENYQDYILDQL